MASGMDPTGLWRQWLESGTRMWPGTTGGQENYLDPTGVYQRWFDGMREMQERMIGATPEPVLGNPSVQDVWRRWFESAGESWRRGAELSQNAMEVLPRWTQMLEEARDNLLAAGAPPSDPLQLATQWYNATSGPFSNFVGDLIEREEFLEPSSRFLQSYASFYKVFKHNSEEYLKNLQIPVRSDITRVAGLVVNLEDKVDKIEETIEDLDLDAKEAATTEALTSLEQRLGGLESALEGVVETGARATTEALASLDRRISGLEGALEGVAETGAQAATAGSVRALEGRLDRVENKLDRLLAALENGSAGASTNGSAAVEVEATDAAQRKARELGVDLTTVEGTGVDGRITVDDVRKKGES